jgi:predicted GNAT family N-acyltransferase
MAEIAIVDVRTRAQLEQAFAIRRAVFVEEQGVAEALEIDDRDDEGHHLLALRAGEALGTLRLRWPGDRRTAKIERVAVLAPGRGAGIGQALMQAALALAASGGAEVALVHAQTVAQAFYQRLGFAPFGPVFDEDGIRHVAMRRPLALVTKTGDPTAGAAP